MKKSLLSALGLAVALAFSMPALGMQQLPTPLLHAATTTTTTAAPAKTAVKKVAAKKTVKKHKVPRRTSAR